MEFSISLCYSRTPDSPTWGSTIPCSLRDHKWGNEWGCGEGTPALNCCSKEVTMLPPFTSHSWELAPLLHAWPREIESNAQKGKGTWWQFGQSQPLSGMETYILLITSILGNSNKDGVEPIFLRNTYPQTPLWVIASGCYSTFTSWTLARSGRNVNTQSKHPEWFSVSRMVALVCHHSSPASAWGHSSRFQGLKESIHLPGTCVLQL